MLMVAVAAMLQSDSVALAAKLTGSLSASEEAPLALTVSVRHARAAKTEYSLFYPATITEAQLAGDLAVLASQAGLFDFELAPGESVHTIVSVRAARLCCMHTVAVAVAVAVCMHRASPWCWWRVTAAAAQEAACRPNPACCACARRVQVRA